MVTFQGNRSVYFDVDDTLMEWLQCGEDDPQACKIENNGFTFFKRPIQVHVEELKNQKMAGNTVVVWSAGGAKWAEAVLIALGVQDFVDVVLTKPDFYYDDKEVNYWFPKKRYFFHEQLENDIPRLHSPKEE